MMYLKGVVAFLYVLTQRKCCSTANNVVLLHSENTAHLPVEVRENWLVVCVSLPSKTLLL